MLEPFVGDEDTDMEFYIGDIEMMPCDFQRVDSILYRRLLMKSDEDKYYTEYIDAGFTCHANSDYGMTEALGSLILPQYLIDKISSHISPKKLYCDEGYHAILHSIPDDVDLGTIDNAKEFFSKDKNKISHLSGTFIIRLNPVQISDNSLMWPPLSTDSDYWMICVKMTSGYIIV